MRRNLKLEELKASHTLWGKGMSKEREEDRWREV